MKLRMPAIEMAARAGGGVEIPAKLPNGQMAEKSFRLCSSPATPYSAIPPSVIA